MPKTQDDPDMPGLDDPDDPDILGPNEVPIEGENSHETDMDDEADFFSIMQSDFGGENLSQDISRLHTPLVHTPVTVLHTPVVRHLNVAADTFSPWRASAESLFVEDDSSDDDIFGSATNNVHPNFRVSSTPLQALRFDNFTRALLPPLSASTAAAQAPPAPPAPTSIAVTHTTNTGGRTRSTNSAGVMKKWVDSVFYAHVPVDAHGNELRDSSNNSLIRPRIPLQAIAGRLITSIYGPSTDAIARGLQAIILAHVTKTTPTLPTGVTTGRGFQVRNLFHQMRTWRA